MLYTIPLIFSSHFAMVEVEITMPLNERVEATFLTRMELKSMKYLLVILSPHVIHKFTEFPTFCIGRK